MNSAAMPLCTLVHTCGLKPCKGLQGRMPDIRSKDNTLMPLCTLVHTWGLKPGSTAQQGRKGQHQAEMSHCVQVRPLDQSVQPAGQRC